MVTRAEVYASHSLCGKIKRYHTWPMLQPQSTGEHAWRVACLYVELFGLPRAEVLYYCLHHDSGELWAGDMPFGSKDDGIREQERHGLELLRIQLPELSEEESIRFKICDLLEMHETGMHELRLGNQYADPIMKDTLELAIDLSLKYDNHDLNKAIHDYIIKRGKT